MARVVDRGWLDRLGTVASALCAVHCALTGLAFGVLSVVGLDFLANKTTEIAFITVTVTLGSLAVVHGARKHRSYAPALLFVLGLVLLTLAHTVFSVPLDVHAHDHAGHHHGDHGHSPQAAILSVVAGCCFIGFHLLNLRACRRCS